MPNIENLKKQARQFVRWHRERHYPVAAEIRAMLPRFGSLSDVEILKSAFKLADALDLVARRQGFEDWQALKSGDAPMSKSATPVQVKPVLLATAAQLFVADVAKACAFYEDRLGFAVEFTYGDPPFYGMVARDGARLALRLVHEPVFVGDIREREQLLAGAVTVSTTAEIKQLFLAFEAAGVAFHQALKSQPWGARDFIIRDPDGNLVLFAGPQDDGGSGDKA